METSARLRNDFHKLPILWQSAQDSHPKLQGGSRQHLEDAGDICHM